VGQGGEVRRREGGVIRRRAGATFHNVSFREIADIRRRADELGRKDNPRAANCVTATQISVGENVVAFPGVKR
jgi:hypothetical protein